MDIGSWVLRPYQTGGKPSDNYVLALYRCRNYKKSDVCKSFGNSHLLYVWEFDFYNNYCTNDQQLYQKIVVKLESRKDSSNQGDVQEGEGDVESFLEDKSLRTSHKVWTIAPPFSTVP